MTKPGPASAVLLTCLFVMGCAWAPRSIRDAPDESLDVEDHVRFLARPALDGRRPKSLGSMRARRYIARRFEEYGLEPWGDAQGFLQSARFATNVVGVLPGQDPELANEVVLVSAHYDHLGGGKLGATDNASGVGVLLELAQRMTRAPVDNKRTLCFAAFDCEEWGLWGSMIFTRRTDFDPSRIAAMINVDMVGRTAFDCMEDTLFLGQSHTSPLLRDSVSRVAEGVGLRLLPCPALLPSDHVPFTALGIPALFFTTGPFTDYHTKEDTVDKLDWQLVHGATDVASETVRRLATAPTPFGEPLERLGSREDLATVREVLTAQVDTQEDDVARKIRASTQAIDKILASESYTNTEACGLVRDALLSMGPNLALILGMSPDEFDPKVHEPWWRSLMVSLLFFERHQADVMGMYGEVADVLTGKEEAPEPNIYPMPKELKKYNKKQRRMYKTNHHPHRPPPDLYMASYPLHDEEIAIDTLENGQRHLGVLLPEIHISAWHLRNPLMIPRAEVKLGWSVFTCRGDSDTLIDYCLRQWRQRTYISGTGDSAEQRAQVWRHVLQRVAPLRPAFETLEDAFAYRLAETGRADAHEWRLRILRKKNVDMLRESIPPWMSSSDDGLPVYRDILLDTSVPVDIRARLLSSYYQVEMGEPIRFDGQMLRDLEALSEDTTPIIPFANDLQLDLPLSLEMAPLLNAEHRQKYISYSCRNDIVIRTLGEAARIRLAEIAEASGVEDLSYLPDGVALSEACTLTLFPTGDMTIYPLDKVRGWGRSWGSGHPEFGKKFLTTF